MYCSTKPPVDVRLNETVRFRLRICHSHRDREPCQNGGNGEQQEHASSNDSGNTKLNQVGSSRYLGVNLGDRGGSEKAVRARVNAAWNKWKEDSGVICV